MISASVPSIVVPLSFHGRLDRTAAATEDHNYDGDYDPDYRSVIIVAPLFFFGACLNSIELPFVCVVATLCSR
jgi:hypothetical protein